MHLTPLMYVSQSLITLVKLSIGNFTSVIRELITSPTNVVLEILTQQSNELTIVGSDSLDLCQVSRFEIIYTPKED